MAQVTREICRCIIEAFERKDVGGGFPLTSREKAQLAYAWLERENERDYSRSSATVSANSESMADMKYPWGNRRSGLREWLFGPRKSKPTQPTLSKP